MKETNGKDKPKVTKEKRQRENKENNAERETEVMTEEESDDSTVHGGDTAKRGDETGDITTPEKDRGVVAGRETQPRTGEYIDAMSDLTLQEKERNVVVSTEMVKAQAKKTMREKLFRWVKFGGQVRSPEEMESIRKEIMTKQMSFEYGSRE